MRTPHLVDCPAYIAAVFHVVAYHTFLSFKECLDFFHAACELRQSHYISDTIAAACYTMGIPTHGWYQLCQMVFDVIELDHLQAIFVRIHGLPPTHTHIQVQFFVRTTNHFYRNKIATFYLNYLSRTGKPDLSTF